MTIKSVLAATAMALTLSFSANATTLTPEQAQTIVQPLYTFLSNPTDADTADKARAIFSDDWQSYYSNTSAKGLEQTMKSIAGIGKLIPDLHWEIVEVKVSGDTAIVRGEATGTPNGDFFGAPHSGKRFKIMSIDLHTIEEGQIVKSYHVEDWAGAVKQLTAKK